MSVYTDKRTGRLFVQFQYKGQTFKQYLPDSSSRKDAEKLETKMKSDAFFQANGMMPSQKKPLFEEFVAATYLPSLSNSADAFERATAILTLALPFLKGKPIDEVKPADVERFKSFLESLPTQHSKPDNIKLRKPATIVREMAIISAVFTSAVKNDLSLYNPCSRVPNRKFDNLVDKVLEIGDDELFFAAFDPVQGIEARDACKLIINTGLSQKDLFNLTPFQINLQTRSLVLTRSKTVRPLRIPLNDVAFEICKARLSGGPLFVSRKTKKKLTSIKSAMAGACKRANIEREKLGLSPMHILTIRDLRRTFGTRLYEQGVDVLTIAQLLGHSDLRTIWRYIRTVKNARPAVENLEKFSLHPTPSLRSISG